jgi:phage repressor protein C with HTH and peptisase S24 domain
MVNNINKKPPPVSVMRVTQFESFLQRVFQATGMNSQTQLAEALGVNRSAITQARKKDSIPARWILQLYRLFGLNPDWLESGAGQTYLARSDDHGTEFRNIPKVKARLSAGGGSFEVGTEIQGYYAFQQEWLRRKGEPHRMVLMDIFGNSMEPELKDGDTVLIDESQKDIIAGALYAVGVDDTIMVKRVEKHPNKLVLRSDNHNYLPIYLEGEETRSIRIIGKVIWAGREFH